MPRAARVPALGCSTKARNKKLCLLFVPSPTEQLRQPGACRASSLQVRCTFCPPRPQPQSPPALVRCMRPVSLCDPAGGCRPSSISGGLLLETGGLFAVPSGLWSLGQSLPLSPPPCLQSPAGLGRSIACELFSGLARSLCSENGRQCVLAG